MVPIYFRFAAAYGRLVGVSPPIEDPVQGGSSLRDVLFPVTGLMRTLEGVL